MSKELLDTIQARRSIRKYTSKQVSKEDIKSLLEAAMAAPSASNGQPWHFVVVTERNRLDSLATGHPYAKMLYQATLCIVVCGIPADSDFWEQDCAAATENLLLAATAMELGSVWVGVYPRDQRVAFVRQELGIPDEIIPFNLIAVGHPAEEREPRTHYNEGRIHRETW